MEFMQDLVAEKVVMAWPKPGKAAVVKLVDCLPHWLREAIESPDDFWVPWDAMPDHSRKSKVRADDHQWWLICRAAHERGLMSYVDDEELPKDRGGHYICGGAGGVKKIKNINGKEVAAQRFISIFCPQNEVMQLLPGAQDTLPYIGQLAGILAEKDEYLVLDLEDLESAFNLFEMPRAWWPIFNYGKKVALTAFGGKDKRMVRPVLKVVPMGWSSAVTLVQAAVRHLVFERAAIDPRGDITRLNPLPASKQYSLIYLDNFDQITKLTAAEMEVARGEPSPDHAKFIKACDELGLPRNLGKQVLASFVGCLQGGELLGHEGILRMPRNKTREFISLSLALLSQKGWLEFPLRHWAGKGGFLSTFRRPLYSIMQEVFHSIEAAKGKQGGIRPSEVVMDEVFSLMSLSICAELNLRAPISSEISCTDASPTGGGSAIASKFKEKSLLMNAPVSPAATVCSQCSGGWPADLGARRYECPRHCGALCCTLVCARAHHDQTCPREGWYSPSFGERLSGPNYRLTKAVGLAGVLTQRPLDGAVDGWDFFTTGGKETLSRLQDAWPASIGHCPTAVFQQACPILCGAFTAHREFLGSEDRTKF